jgi:hypothetical protein
LIKFLTRANSKNVFLHELIAIKFCTNYSWHICAARVPADARRLQKECRFTYQHTINVASNIPFKYISSMGLLFIFAGLIVLVLKTTQSRKEVNANQK